MAHNSGDTVADLERSECVPEAERPGAVASASAARAPCPLPVSSAVTRVARGSAGVREARRLEAVRLARGGGGRAGGALLEAHARVDLTRPLSSRLVLLRDQEDEQRARAQQQQGERNRACDEQDFAPDGAAKPEPGVRIGCRR